jgi:hypothetical protein
MVSGTSGDLSALSEKGFQTEFHSHAQAILSVDFPDALSELQSVLMGLTIPIEEIIAGGGGEAKGTQRLRKALTSANWLKTKFEIKKIINGRELESISHEVDHVWPAPGSEDTELGVFMGPEVGHGETEVYTGVQA